jgi:hypothetical protein
MAICAVVAPRSWQDTTLEGACGFASYALVRALKLQGRAATFVRGWYGCGCGGEDCYSRDAPIGHCWVEVNGTIVDITARQFHDTAPDVFIPSNEERHHYDAEERGTHAIHGARSWYRLQNSWMLQMFEPRVVDPLVEAALGLPGAERDGRGS